MIFSMTKEERMVLRELIDNEVRSGVKDCGVLNDLVQAELSKSLEIASDRRRNFTGNKVVKEKLSAMVVEELKRLENSSDVFRLIAVKSIKKKMNGEEK